MKNRTKLLIGFLEVVLFAVIVLVFALLKWDDYFDEIDGFLFSMGHLITIFFRFLVYLVPAFIIWVIFLFIKKQKLTLKDSYRFQFIAYSIVGLIWVLGGLDYVTSTDVFGAMDSFTIMIGLLLSLIFKKEIKVDSDIPSFYKKSRNS